MKIPNKKNTVSDTILKNDIKYNVFYFIKLYYFKYLILSNSIGPQMPFLMYLAAGILIVAVNIIFFIRAFTYLSTRKAIYKTSTLMGEEVKGSLLNDVINLVKVGKLIVLANIIYQIIEIVQNYRILSSLLTYGSFFFSLYVLWDEYSSD